jgi:hypothetical protein
LAVTSYPLISRNQYYLDATRQTRVQFPSESAEGEYNAFRRMLLKSTIPMQGAAGGTGEADPWRQAPPDVSSPVDGDYLLDYASPFASHSSHVEHRPSVWINVLGRDAWWPVAALPQPASTQPQYRSSPLLLGPFPEAHRLSTSGRRTPLRCGLHSSG